MTPVEICALILGGGVAALIVGELATRAWLRARGNYYVLKRWARTVNEIDRTSLPTLEEQARIEVNGDGERGPELPRDTAGTYRVLVCGGSAAECFLLDQASTWPAVVLQALAPEASRLGAHGVHVGNISRSLVACDYIEMMLARVLPHYTRLDVVVLMVGASDVVAWLERSTPEVVEEGERKSSYAFEEHPEGPFGWTPGTLALRRVVSLWRRRLLRPVGRRTQAGARLIANRAMRARGEMVDEIPDPTPMLVHFERWLRRTVETARGKASRVLVVRQPWLRKAFTPEEDQRLWNFGGGRPYLEEVTTYYSHDVVNRLMGGVDQVAARVADDMGVESLDLMQRLSHDFETFYDRLHFTPAGARVVGTAVAEAILEGAD